MSSLYWNSPLVTLRFTSASSLTWKKKKNFVSKTFKTNNSFYLNGFEIYNGHFKSINMSNKHTDVHVQLLCNIIILDIKIYCGMKRKITCQDLLVTNMITDKIKFKAERIQLTQKFETKFLYSTANHELRNTGTVYHVLLQIISSKNSISIIVWSAT